MSDEMDLPVEAPVVVEPKTPEAVDKKEEKEDFLDKLPKEIQDHINGIKAQGISVFLVFLGENGYFFRPIKVMEFMRLQEAQKQRGQAEGVTDEYLQNKWLDSIALHANIGVMVEGDLGVEKLLPAITRESINGQPAGVPSSLAQQILRVSGFDSDPAVIKL